ncbi:MAG TPA: phenylalanine--tRNA ligase subunit beta [Acidimicrobiales bacterium]|nr:phenylalanine--tRNA ligase subunit beta [Acidimicrobiales bacterium]
MRAPLSWLRDFAPFPDDIGVLTAALDDLGLVVEGVERVGEGLEDVVVARVTEKVAIEGADRIRRVVVDAGGDPVEIVCGADNYEVGDRVPLAPVGAVLPGGFEISRRKMRGVTSNGMLCSGRELGLSEDGAGLLVFGDDTPAPPGTPITEALGLLPDTVLDITVEGNRPDAWCMVGIARDLAARLRLPFTAPSPTAPRSNGIPTGERASAVVQAPALCPRLTVSVFTGVTVAPSPEWVAKRLTLAGMRPINNVVDASNYVMLELGQPTHPYDLSLLGGHGLLVRQARSGETIKTLDDVTRTVGLPGRGLGDTGEDCLICDAVDRPVGIAGIMGGASSEISGTTTEVLLEAAYFTPMAIARTSKSLALRTEASARFERGTDPWVIDAAVTRFADILAETSPGLAMCDDTLDVRGDIPQPFALTVPITRVQRQVGVALGGDEITALIAPIGFACQPGPEAGSLTVTVPTNRPDVRPAPFGIDDVIEEVARTFGYSNIPRRTPTWPQPGRVPAGVRSRRVAKDVLCGLGVSEGWTNTFVSEEAHDQVGLTGPAVRVSNPLTVQEPFLRRSLMPGLLGALGYNAARRQGSVRLYEVGVVFSHPDEGQPRRVKRTGAGGAQVALLPGERELLVAVFAHEEDDARTATVAWHVLADAFRLTRVRLVAPEDGLPPLPGLHPTRSAHLVAAVGSGAGEQETHVIGAVGEIDPQVATSFGLTMTGATGTVPRRIGWLEVDLGLLLDDAKVARRPMVSAAVSRFPSSDIDLAVVVADTHPADVVAEVLGAAAGELLESVALFDVYRGQGISEGERSLAFRLRFCSLDHTLTDEEVGSLRAGCIKAVETTFGARLR